MKILYHHRTQAEDGQAIHVRQLLRAFEEVGHEVSEVGLVRHGSAASSAPALDPKVGESNDRKAGRARWAWVTRLPRFARELAEYGYSGVAKNHILREAAWFEPDFLYERYAFGNVAGVLAAGKLGLPLVLEVNAPLVDELSATRGVSLKGIARRLERFVLSASDVVCVVSGVLRDRMLELGAREERTVITPNGVRIEDYDYADRAAVREQARRDLDLPEALCIGFVGYYRSWHRLDIVLDALCSPELQDAHLALVGEGPAESELREKVKSCGLASRVHFLGPRPSAEVPALLPAFDVGVVPAINEYASPLKLHEYMAAGLPVVAPDQPNLREVLTDGVDGRLVAPGRVEAMVAALGALANDADERARMGAEGRVTLDRKGLTWRDNVWRVMEAVTPHLHGSSTEGARAPALSTREGVDGSR